MAYRDLKATLEQQRVQLEQEQRTIDDELARLETLKDRRAALGAELAAVSERLRDVGQNRHHLAFRRIRVASPCSARWEDMRGDDRVRFCKQCSKHVYDLSAMTSEEAAALVYDKEGELCARFLRRADGTVITSDCAEGVSRRRRRLVMAAVATAVATGSCALQLADQVETVVMGNVSHGDGEVTEL